jgi:hypothetical protein
MDMRELKIMIDQCFEAHLPNIEVLVARYPVEMMQVRALLEIAKNLE